VTRADGHPVVTISGVAHFWRLHARLKKRLPVWTVYRPITREYPGLWMARMHVVLPVVKPTRFVLIHDSLEELRTLLPPGLVKAAADPRDVPEIEETWL